MKMTHVIALFLICFVYVGVVAGADKRPNILLIVTDDQAPHTLKAYGNKVCETPHLDRLAGSGLVFDGAYHMGSWSGAVCTPSRHMIMTGRTVWHLPKGRRGRGGGKHAPANLAHFSMAAVFNRAGYDTFRTCKRGNSYEAANKLFTTRKDATKRGGTAASGSAWHGDQAVAFLKGRAEAKDRKPFLMYFGFSHPHDVRDGLPVLLEKYGAYNAKKPPTKVNPKAPPLQINYLPAHPFHHGHPGLRDEVRVSGVFRSRSEATIRNEQGRDYACIENIDRQIGRVLKVLRETGELDNTYIFFTADHGMSVGRHGLTGKQNLYQHTWRVPMIVSGPGIKGGRRAEGNVYLLDLLPTMCEMAGIKIPKTVEGKSFLPVLTGEKKVVREVLYGVYCGGTKPGMRSLKKGKWKLIKYDVMDGKVRETQLFNLEENPDELLKEHHAAEVVRLTGHKPKAHQVNLADDPKYAAKRRELEALLLSEMKRLDDPYRLWDQPMKKGG